MKDIHEVTVVIRNVIEATFFPVIGMIETPTIAFSCLQT